MKKIVFLISFYILIVINHQAHAEENYSLVINGLSKHFDVNQDTYPNGLNEKNLGLGAEYDFNKTEKQKIQWVLNGGFYKDSLDSTALYFGGAGLVNIFNYDSFHLNAGIEVSFFYSKEYNQGNPFIAPLPIINIGNEKYSLNITAIPRVQQIIDAGVIFAQLKIGI